MAQPRSLSIRVKILLLLTLLPLVVLGAYLYLAIEVFQNDKIAYVYEGITSFSRTLGLQTSTDLNATLTAAKPILQDFGQKQEFGEMSKNLLSGDSNIFWVAAFGQDETGKFVQRALVGRDESRDQAELDLVLMKPGLLESIPHQKRVVTLPVKEDKLLLGEYVDDAENARRWIFLVMFKSEQLFQAFRAPGGSENFLVDATGRVLMGPPEKEGTSLTDTYAISFLGQKDSSQSNGTEEARDTQGEAILVSYSKLGIGQLTVVSAVPKKAALQAVSILIRKSLIFFAILLCATVIISLVASKNLTASLSALFQATQKIAAGRFDVRIKVTGNDEVGSLGSSFNKMASEISRLMGETAEKARMESELKTAQTVQETLFPPVSAQIADMAVHGFYEPASECGGDWWHYNWVNGKVFLWIGDATGHGAPAALLTSAAKSASTIIENLRIDPATALDLLNRSIFDVSKGKIMMTFFLASYDPKTRILTYSNASHEAPYLIRRGSAPPKKRDLVPLNDVNNPRLGQSRETRYAQTSIELQEGDRIFFYTDGIPDIQNPKKEAWGEREFLKALLEANRDYPAIDVAVERLTRNFQGHRQQAALIDDVTFFMTEVRSGGLT